LAGKLIGDPDTALRGLQPWRTPAPVYRVSGQRALPHQLQRHGRRGHRREDASGLTGLPRIVCSDPYAYFARVSSLLNPLCPTQRGGNDCGDRCHCVIASDAEVGALVVIGKNTVVGARSRIGAGCVIGRDVVLGEDVVLHPKRDGL